MVAQQQLVRSGADGASLAAAFDIARQGATLPAATLLAQQVVTQHGLPATDLNMAYLDSSGQPTLIPGSVAYVKATVTDARRTYFLAVLGISTWQVSASAQASTGTGGTSACAVCLMAGSGTTLDARDAARLTVSGAPVIVNSTGNPNIHLHPLSSLAAPAITIAGGTYQVDAGATISPTPTVGSALGDPLTGVAAPNVAGPPVSYTAPAGPSSISPGQYSAITAGVGSALTLNAGVYVLTGPLSVSGSIVGNGVLLYLACTGYPTPCAQGASGATLNVSGGGSLTLSAPTSGVFSGLAVFADRANQAANTVNNGTLSVTGTWYTLLMPLNQTHAGDQLTFVQLLAASLAVDTSVIFKATYAAAQTYRGSGIVGLNL